MLTSEAEFWVQRWRTCLPPPADASARAARLTRSLARWRALNADIAAVDNDIAALLASSDGQILTTLPGVGTSRAAAFAAPSRCTAARGLPPNVTLGSSRVRRTTATT